MHTVFLIMGESGSGKDSLVSKICKEEGFIQICSYTTRPQRNNEGNTHIFISPNDVDKYKDEMIAYTKIGEFEYFATLSQLKESNFYIIDAKGVKYLESLKDKINFGDIRFVKIFINVPKHIREERVLNKRKDNEVDFYKRCFNEDVQFKEMLIEGSFDYCISNIDLKKSYNIFKYIVNVEEEEELKEMFNKYL